MAHQEKCEKCGKPVENKGHKIDLRNPYGGKVVYYCDSCYSEYKQYRKREYGR